MNRTKKFLKQFLPLKKKKVIKQFYLSVHSDKIALANNYRQGEKEKQNEMSPFRQSQQFKALLDAIKKQHSACNSQLYAAYDLKKTKKQKSVKFVA